MEDLNYYLKELRLLKDSPNLEQLLLKMENEENSNWTVRAIVTEALASIWQYRRDKKNDHMDNDGLLSKTFSSNTVSITTSQYSSKERRGIFTL